MATARFYGRMLGAPDAEIESAAITASAALASGVMRRAAVASELRRESALAVTLDDGILVEGIADLVFQEIQPSGEQIWTVVDFKTDAYIDGHLDEYRTQLALYMRAIERATNLSTQGILLWI
jgi:ATP-dependent exoDNAse (exonuclease V) beta subunit